MGRSKIGWRGVAASALLAVVGNGCANGSASSASASREAEATRPTVTTSVGPSGTTSTPPRSKHRTLRAPTNTTAPASTRGPVLRNTGRNYVAIYRSLDASRRWLEAEHPDPALVDRVWVPGTKIATTYREKLGWLRAHHLRWISVGDSSTVEVASVVGTTVSLRVEQHLQRVDVVNAHGSVVGQRAVGPVFHWIVLLSNDGTGRWTIAAVDPRLTTDVEVDL